MLRTVWTCILTTLCPVAAAVAAPAIVDPGQGPVPLLSGTTAAGGLSGITHVGGGDFRAVGDSGGFGGLLHVPIDRASGQIASAAVTVADGYTYTGRVDAEGIAWHPATGRVLISDETGNQLAWHPAAGGASTGSVTVPTIYGSARNNLSLESVAIGPDGSIWTANEEALSTDGNAGPNSIVRIQRFNAAGEPTGQWAHRTGGHITGASMTNNSGVVDLAVLPDGRLLALERAVGARITGWGIPLPAQYVFRNRVLLLDFDDATDVSDRTSLVTPTGVTFAGVTELWSSGFTAHNFEGMALGETLDTLGEYSLLLISDDDTFPALEREALGVRVRVPATPVGQSLYALRLTGVPIPEPASAAMLLLIALGVAQRRRRAGMATA